MEIIDFHLFNFHIISLTINITYISYIRTFYILLYYDKTQSNFCDGRNYFACNIKTTLVINI